MTPNIQNGARVFVYINGNVLGLVTSFSWSSDTSSQEISGIDVDYLYELGPGTVRVSGTLSLYKLITDAGSQSYGLTTQQYLSNSQKYVSIVLVDRGIDTVLFQCDYARINNENWTIASKNLMTGTLSFQGLLWSNNG